MAKTFYLPDLGEGLQEAEIIEWKVKEGDNVKVDDPLVAVETDKAVVDVPSPYTGKILKLLWKNGKSSLPPAPAARPTTSAQEPSWTVAATAVRTFAPTTWIRPA